MHKTNLHEMKFTLLRVDNNSSFGVNDHILFRKRQRCHVNHLTEKLLSSKILTNKG